ncbi:large ribosomal subunit protein uL11m isoform X1 [Mycteria americana]|uniref:large ribosomal subunit protein uL11m isoform X1 n=1 Tax=Mycteria americana TaxID=33587 RepID=UPI003F58B07C
MMGPHPRFRPRDLPPPEAEGGGEWRRQCGARFPWAGPRDPYAVLGVRPDASPAEIRAAFLARCKEVRGGGSRRLPGREGPSPDGRLRAGPQPGGVAGGGAAAAAGLAPAGAGGRGGAVIPSPPPPNPPTPLSPRRTPGCPGAGSRSPPSARTSTSAPGTSRPGSRCESACESTLTAEDCAAFQHQRREQEAAMAKEEEEGAKKK